jgi:putative peptide zinc metalloprotease protein
MAENPEKIPKPSKLKKLRKGLKLTFSDYDLDGKPQWLIHDAGRNKFFIIGWLEYELLKRWDLGTAEALIASTDRETTLHVEMSDIENLSHFLSNHFLFKQSGYEIHNAADEQEIFRNDNLFHWLITYYLFFRIPLLHPDKFLLHTRIIADFLFSRYTLYFMTLLGVVAIYQVSMQWSDFTHTFTSLISWQGLFLYMIVFTVCKMCHELGHAYMCRSYGVPVPTLGVAFLVFWPVLYTDTTLSWSLNSKARLRIALAGIWVETYVTIIAALVWCNTHNTTLQTVCYMVVAVNWTASLLINVSPFMRFDGYYVLSDFLRMPNLQPRAFALTRWQMRRWLFNWSDPPPEKFSPHLHHILVIYSIVTWLYRLILYMGIAVLVYHFFIKLLGIVLFGVELYYFILGPFVNEAKTWYKLKDRFSWNINTIITTSIAGFLVILFFLPIHETISIPGTMGYAHRFLVAPDDGMIATKIPAIGTTVKADKPIIVINSELLDNDLKATYLEYTKSISELRRSAVDAKYAHQKDIMLSEIRKQQAKYEKLHSALEKLTLAIPFDGVIIDLAPDLHEGDMVMKNQWLGDVAEPHTTKIEAFAPQVDINSIKKNQAGYFYPHNLSYPRVPVKVASIELLNTSDLNCNFSQELKQDRSEEITVDTPCYNASELGGEIPTYTTDSGEYVPVTSVYRVVLIAEKPVDLKQVERGTVILKTIPRSYAYRFIYKLKKILIEQSGF